MPEDLLPAARTAELLGCRKHHAALDKGRMDLPLQLHVCVGRDLVPVVQAGRTRVGRSLRVPYLQLVGIRVYRMDLGFRIWGSGFRVSMT